MTICSKGCVTLWFKATQIKSFFYQVWWPCDGRSTTNLIFHVTLQDQVVEEPGDFTEGSFLLYIPTLQSSVDIGIVVVNI